MILLCFGVAEFSGYQHRDVCPLNGMMGTDDTLKVQKNKNKNEKAQQQCLFSEIMTQLLKIIQKSCRSRSFM